MADRGLHASSAVATLVAPLLGWDETTAAAEVAAYGERLRAERESQTHAEDLAADTARRAAADRRTPVGAASEAS